MEVNAWKVRKNLSKLQFQHRVFVKIFHLEVIANFTYFDGQIQADLS